jgi:uncharacterized protein YecE (DUF72 family)
MAGRLHAGTSGFSYASWRGGFYPPDSRPEDYLRHYAARLSSVELNVTGYRLPSEAQLEAWAEQTPSTFRFAVRMSRQVTDRGRLDRFAPFVERVRVFGERLGPILVSLPEERPRDDGLLAFLLGSVDPDLRFAFDLRHESWAAADVGKALRAAGAARVGDLSCGPGFAYLRLREPPWPDPWLDALADRVLEPLRAGADVFAYFRHEDEPRGALAAERLARAVQESSGQP